MKKTILIATLSIAALGGAVWAALPQKNLPQKCSSCNGTGWSGQMKCFSCGGDGDRAN
jgi:hypothetical protein